MARRQEPEDERLWSDINQYHQLGGIHTNSVHFYFYNSEFFDKASNNEVVFRDAMRFANKAELLQSRKAFEDEVQSLSSGGIQFLIVSEPQTEDGAWIMQKQNRIVQRDKDDKIEVLGNYMIIGERITMLPNLADILQSRFLSITTALSNVFNTVSDLTHFTPATGSSYLPPSYKPPKATDPGSRAGSRAGSVVPDDSSQIQGTQSSLAEATNVANTAVIESKFSDRFFLNSLALTDQYQNEYTDENPLTGEPGSFVFTSTTQRVAAQNAVQVAAQQKVQGSATTAAPPSNAGDGPPIKSIEGESALSTAAPTPKEGPHSRKGSLAKAPKIKDGRRKSKAPTSPTSPAG